MKAKANSIANLSYNLLGYFPAPFLYGIARDALNDSDDPKKSTGGMKMLMWMTVVCAALLFIAIPFRKTEEAEPG